MSDSVERARQMDRFGRKIRVLVVVKTMPSPSTRYEETVCVAGIATDPYRWVRLYPVRYRDYDKEEQFKKYQLIDIEVGNPQNDLRVESLHVEGPPSVCEETLIGWDNRYPYIAQMPEVTLCQLQQDARANKDGQSLAAIRVRNIPKIKVERHQGWTQKQLDIIEQWARPDLFGTEKPPLKAPSFTLKLKFQCLAPDCKGHELSLIDWECKALQRHFKEDSINEAKKHFQQKFIDQKFKDGLETRILVGNQENPQRRAGFLALGFFGPYEEPLTGFYDF